MYCKIMYTSVERFSNFLKALIGVLFIVVGLECLCQGEFTLMSWNRSNSGMQGYLK